MRLATNSDTTLCWTPILSPESSTATAAWEAVDAVAHAIIDGHCIQAPNRLNGHEEAILYGYLAAGRRDFAWAERATDRLNGAIVAAPQPPCWLGLYGGLAGLAWSVEHLPRLFDEVFPPDGDDDSGDSEDEDPAEHVGGLIVRELRRTRAGSWPNTYDLIGGLVGYGVYFLERWPRQSAVEGLTLVLDHLEGLAETMTPGIAWHTGADLLPDWQRQRCPSGYYNLGAAHGIPGILYLLGELCATGVERARALRLLEDAVAWLIAQKRPSGSVSCFGSWIAPGESSDSRLSWCYGDLGIAAVMLHVSRRTGREDWSRVARALLDHCLTWPEEATGIRDAPLCHGAAGVAHIFNRAYQAEGDPRYRDGALRWFDRALAMREPGTGVGGFSAIAWRDPGRYVREASPAFLDGAIGVALSLLGALTDVEPRWDRLLLLSGRS